MLKSLVLLALFALAGPQAWAVSEIVVAIRYLQPKGVSHSHLYLYREDGKFLRQLTNDDSGQDADPIFSPDGESIVFTREKIGKPLEFWSIGPLGNDLKQLDAAPDWYSATKNSPYFTNREPEKPAEQSPSPGPSASPEESASPGSTSQNLIEPQRYASDDGSVELVLREDPADPDDQADGAGHGKHYLVRYPKSGTETEFGKIPGFYGVFEILHESQNAERHFLFDGLLRVAFFGLHLNSTDGDTCFALDLNGPRLVRLSPNWAAPIPLPGEAAFLALVGNRYVPIPGSSMTANCSYMEHWDAELKHIRYARPGSAAICYGLSMYRPDRTPTIVTIKQTAD
jgi:WD40-like Beta Propeller Repeat